MRSLTPHLKATPTFAFGAQTADANGTAVARDNSETATFEILVGAWTDGTHTITFEEEIGSTWTAITAAFLDADPGVLTGASVVISSAAKDGTRIFVTAATAPQNRLRAVKAISGETTGATYGVDVIEFGQRAVGMNPMVSTAFNA